MEKTIKNRLVSESTCDSISKAKKQSEYKHSEKTRRKISESLKHADRRKNKFSAEYIQDALDMYDSGKYNKRFVANEFGISPSYFGELINRRK